MINLTHAHIKNVYFFNKHGKLWKENTVNILKYFWERNRERSVGKWEEEKGKREKNSKIVISFSFSIILWVISYDAK